MPKPISGSRNRHRQVLSSVAQPQRSKRKVTVKHSKRAPPGITFLSHGLEQSATKGDGSTLLQTVPVQGWAGHVSKVVSQASCRSSSPRALKRAPDSRDPLIFRLLCQAHQQRCKTLVFQHALVDQNKAEHQFISLAPWTQKGLR